MFQYATARALALEFGYSLKLDISGFIKYRLHQGFELDRIFQGPFVRASDLEVQRILGWQRSAFAQRLLSTKSLTVLRGDRFIVEPHFNHWSGIKKISDNSYMTGYWQSENYFENHKSTIRNEFTFRLPVSSQNAEISDRIMQCSSVSLHFRRGDYVKNAETIAVHGIASMNYYKLAIRYMCDRVRLPHLFIFSDDIAWVRSNLETDVPCTYLDHNHGQDSFADMRLMSLCRHHIIANSTFSWWGAWLNPSPNKIVVSPKNWFSNGLDARDLIPRKWVTL